jgi:hypothetical protein
MTLRIVTLTIMAEHCNAECHLCCVSLMLSVTYMPFVLSLVMLNVIILSLVMLNVIILSVIMLSIISARNMPILWSYLR